VNPALLLLQAATLDIALLRAAAADWKPASAVRAARSGRSRSIAARFFCACDLRVGGGNRGRRLQHLALRGADRDARIEEAALVGEVEAALLRHAS
jgi:hypothetical protein